MPTIDLEAVVAPEAVDSVAVPVVEVASEVEDLAVVPVVVEADSVVAVLVEVDPVVVAVAAEVSVVDSVADLAAEVVADSEEVS